MADKNAFLEQARKRFIVEKATLPNDFAGEWYIRKLNAGERDDYEASKTRFSYAGRKTTGSLDLRHLRARLLVKTLSDAQGVRLFADGDVESLSAALPGDLGDQLFEQALRFNGMQVDEDEEKRLSGERIWQLRFAFAFQRPDVDQLLTELTGEQWGEWKQFFELEPWGTPHEDLRFGFVLSLLSGFGKPQPPSAWFPTLRQETEETDWEIRKLQWQATATRTCGE